MKRIYIFFLAVIAALTACTTEEEKRAEEERMAAEQEVAELKAMVLDAEGNIIFDKTLVNGPYQIGVENKEDAAKLATLYVGSGFTGEEYTRTLPLDKGTVKVSPGKASIYYSVAFDVKDIPQFTLNLKDNRTISAGQSGTYHKCKICGFVWKGTSSVCPLTSRHGN